jgi:carbonic anhydrase/acetyltransferase-like protein (isoleucine patch superfamily)
MNGPLILPVRGFSPKLGPNNWVAPNATIVGNVQSGSDCTFWFQSVVRADVHEIRIGDRVNIQDGAILHGTFEKAGLYIGSDVSLGHRAMVHGCHIHDRVLVGMGAIVMDHAVIESNCLVAAGALVPERAHLKSGWIYAGIPAKPLRELKPEEIETILIGTVDRYPKYANWFRNPEKTDL